MVRMEPEIHHELKRRIYETIISFPGRLDEMETPGEENCRLLARRIADLARLHGGPGGAEPA